jgi:hypothetical protein
MQPVEWVKSVPGDPEKDVFLVRHLPANASDACLTSFFKKLRPVHKVDMLQNDGKALVFFDPNPSNECENDEGTDVSSRLLAVGSFGA